MTIKADSVPPTATSHIAVRKSPIAPSTTSTAGLQKIADEHITKGLGRLRDHVFVKGQGLRATTSVS